MAGAGASRTWENRRQRFEIATIFPGIVPKMHQSLTFLATIGTDPQIMKTLAIISLLALLTISGAAISDQLLTADQQIAQRVD
ncbi:hypothetical protein [Bradyrhizobium sp.]|uniref:hypothetical protein n=1 Tax=Bradyrhizobium sp. TaxID=376 RepID=UPI002399CF85|nr:hypothetical protein [Bradyrhizobium sp.]MDE2377382.1 hypothetical protein [Bradyrhizobium sp.]